MTDKPKTPSETARALLTVAAKRADHLVQLPNKLPAAGTRQVVRSLLKSEWVAEVPTPTTDPAFAWRTGEDGAVMMLQATALGYHMAAGSGSSGGIFSPSLFMGATLGRGFASLLVALGLPSHLSIPTFAMVGMGAMVGGGTGAVVTAVTMTFEMTLCYVIVM